jgi:hypothetical protein
MESHTVWFPNCCVWPLVYAYILCQWQFSDLWLKHYSHLRNRLVSLPLIAPKNFRCRQAEQCGEVVMLWIDGLISA